MKVNLVKRLLLFNVLFLLFVQSCVIAQPELDNSDDDAIVCVTRTGEKYHLCSCRYLSKSSIEINLSDAQKRYDACSVCKPDKFKRQATTNMRRTLELEPEHSDDDNADVFKDDAPKSSTKNATTTGAARQCSAATKSTGQRCSRKTTNVSGKCFQHNK